MGIAENRPSLELWGGVEGTVNRVRDTYFDQLVWSGHEKRLDDIDRIASLGIRTVRYPLVWERIAPEGIEQANWSWADARMSRLYALDMRPIVGLLHHGSGPRETSLLDPQFPEKLAQHARAVAERYPWAQLYTPVNEPLTTARFSGLYGHWYPHGTDNATFLRALVHECRATVLAMQAIRAVQPDAQLIQTEDLGKTYSTPLLAYQAQFENERRWLSLDLLCGRIDADHPMWSYLRDAGITVTELHWFQEHPCPPDIMGINYYVTSERLIDERVERYPAWSHGGNGRHRYADVEAIRAITPGGSGSYGVLREAHERYGVPLAITEAHLGGPRDEQLRWLLESWRGAEALRAEGIDIRAVTIWALFGGFDWNHLVTQPVGFYEPGAFDVRADPPRPTALAQLAQQLATGTQPDHPVLTMPGWWRREDRLVYPAVPVDASPLPLWTHTMSARQQPLLIIGAAGMLGQAFAHVCEQRGLPYHLLSHQELDITDRNAIAAAIAAYTPWAIINAAGYTDVDEAEHEVARCFHDNVDGAEQLALACAAHHIAYLTFSADLVFDGRSSHPYVESDAVAPLNIYGAAKARAETRVLDAYPLALVVRTAALFGPWDANNFAAQTLHSWSHQQPCIAAPDIVVSPTYVPDLVHTCLDLLIDGESGIWHLANDGAVSWVEMARRLATLGGIVHAPIIELSARQRAQAAPRPPYSVLGSERGRLLPTLDDALTRYMQEVERGEHVASG